MEKNSEGGSVIEGEAMAPRSFRFQKLSDRLMHAWYTIDGRSWNDFVLDRTREG